jgi:hypothetical protein
VLVLLLVVPFQTLLAVHYAVMREHLLEPSVVLAMLSERFHLCNACDC